MAIYNVNCGVYAVINTITDDMYVGGTIRINRRLWAHMRGLHHGDHKNKAMQQDWKKYGPEAFAFTVLEFCSPSKLDERERYWVTKLGTYNRTPGGRNNIAFVNADPLVRAQRSVRAKKMHVNGEFGEPYFNSETGRKAQRLSRGNMGNSWKATPEQLVNYSMASKKRWDKVKSRRL